MTPRLLLINLVTLFAAAALSAAVAEGTDQPSAGSKQTNAQRTEEPQAPQRTIQEMAEALQAHFDAQAAAEEDRWQVTVRRGGLWIRTPEGLNFPYGSTKLLPGDPMPGLGELEWLNTADKDAGPDTEGKLVLVEFSATWCGPCVQSMPRIQELYDTYKDEGLEVIVVTNEGQEVFGPYAEKNEYTMPVALAMPGKRIDAFGVTGWPTLFLFRKNVLEYVGDPRFKDLELRIQDLLPEQEVEDE